MSVFSRVRKDLGIRALLPEWRALFGQRGLREDAISGLTVACIAVPLSLAIALDRQEAVAEGDPRSAGQALADDAGIAVVAIAGLDDLLAFAGESAELVVQRERLLEYRARYGCMR